MGYSRKARKETRPNEKYLKPFCSENKLDIIVWNIHYKRFKVFSELGGSAGFLEFKSHHLVESGKAAPKLL